MARNQIDIDIERLRPWAPAIVRACMERTPGLWSPAEDPFVMAGILLRESQAGWGPGYNPKGSLTGLGDSGHGFSPWQFDKRYNAPWIASPEAQTREGQCRFAVQHVREGRVILKALGLRGPILERATVASYNASERRLFRYISAGIDLDRATTGGDYSRWVLAKADALRAAAPGLFTAGGGTV